MKRYSMLLLNAAVAAVTETQGNGPAVNVTPLPDKPTTPEQLRDLKLTQLLEQKPSFATLKALGLDALGKFATQCVEAASRVKSQADKFRKTAKGVGKLLAAMKISYADAQDNGTMAKGTSFEDYHKAIAGEKPWNHAMQCARVFLELVLTQRLEEADYNRRPADWHQTASVILGMVKENGGNLDAPEVAKVIAILKEADDDEGAKQLRQLKASMKGKGEGTGEGDETAPTLTFAEYDTILRRGCSLNFENSISGIGHAASVVRELIPSVADEEILRQLYRQIVRTVDALDKHVTQEQAGRWMDEMQAEDRTAAGQPSATVDGEPVAAAA